MLLAGTAIAGISHVQPMHLSSSRMHLGNGSSLLSSHSLGVNGLAASLDSNASMLRAQMNGQLSTLSTMPMAMNGSMAWGAPMQWYQPMMATNPAMMDPLSMTPIAATELSPLASGPIAPMMPMPIVPAPTANMSYMAQVVGGPWGSVMMDAEGLPITNQLEATSLFAFAPEKPRLFKEHDLVQIVVRETTRITSFQGLETEKEYGLVGGVEAFPGLNNYDLLNYTEVELVGEKEFEGEGEYAREDDMTTRIAAEILEILPNGNLVLEARTRIKTDEEEMFTQLTGICRPDDVTASNTILSNQIFDLQIEKMHYGQVREAANKGILARVLDAVFAF
jgi:flagellar L-ring protein precursor FlgH